MVRGGVLGEIRKVIVEYHQGWLATEQHGKQADWRTDPARSGPAGALGDIGTHAEQLVSFVTGLELSAVAAELTRFVPGRALDDDASMLLRFRGRRKGPADRLADRDWPRERSAARGVRQPGQPELVSGKPQRAGLRSTRTRPGNC